MRSLLSDSEAMAANNQQSPKYDTYANQNKLNLFFTGEITMLLLSMS